MAAEQPQAVQRHLPRLGTGLAVLLLLNSPALAWAEPQPHDGAGVQAGADGYTAWANKPASEVARAAGPTASTTKAAPRSGASGEAPPVYCKQAAGAARVVGALSPIGGTPVDCGDGTDAAPTVTPRQLAQRAWNDLHLPLPDVRTAPPRGSAGLVGLPEWVWVPRTQWQPMSRRVSAGGVWAQVTATPTHLTITPGDGHAPMSCGGPGTAYDPRRSALAQHASCSYTYLRSSAAMPGSAYRVRVTAVWAGTWSGAGGAGGVLPDISRSRSFELRVLEAQGLYG